MREGIGLDGLLAQWRRERPDLDTRCMAVCGEIWRTGRRLTAGLKPVLDRFELDFPSLDVLLTLRRQGRGAHMSPSAMAADMMLSTAAMTARLDKLEKRRLLQRIPDPQDRRALHIRLTDEGFELADEVVVAHVDAESTMLAALSQAERDELLRLLARVASA